MALETDRILSNDNDSSARTTLTVAILDHQVSMAHSTHSGLPRTNSIAPRQSLDRNASPLMNTSSIMQMIVVIYSSPLLSLLLLTAEQILLSSKNDNGKRLDARYLSQDESTQPPAGPLHTLLHSSRTRQLGRPCRCCASTANYRPSRGSPVNESLTIKGWRCNSRCGSVQSSIRSYVADEFKLRSCIWAKHTDKTSSPF